MWLIIFFRGEIGTLEGEKQELLKELRLAESRSNQIMDEGHCDTLVTLADAKGRVINTCSKVGGISQKC